jgi:hypothetical protein
VSFVDSLRLAIALGLALFMILLRFDQERIMRSDYFRFRAPWVGPLSYYGLVAIFMLGIVIILPQGRATLYLVGSEASTTLTPMILFSLVAVLNGAALAFLRYRQIAPLPIEMLPSRTVGATLNAVSEELQFRSLILGLLVFAVGEQWIGLAIAAQAILFAAAHRRFWRTRDWYFLIGSVLLGYGCGLITVGTGSVIPAMVGHFAVTMAIFAFAGGRLRQRLV